MEGLSLIKKKLQIFHCCPIYRAVTAVRPCLLTLLASLERGASERSDANAAALSMTVKNKNFIATAYILSDVLLHFSRLSNAFQVCFNSALNKYKSSL